MTPSSNIVLAAAISVGGCSIIYNPDNIAAKQDAAAIDANPANLTLTDVGPNEILEGQGDGGSRPAIVVVHGNNFVVGAQVELIAATTVHLDVDNTKLQVSADTHYLAVPVTAHVDDAISDGMLVPLTVKVTQPVPGGGTVSQMLDGQLSLHGLDTLTNAIADCVAVKPIYSDIRAGAASALSSSAMKPCVITAVASINLGTLTAKGGNAPGATMPGGTPGPGGCPGGIGLQPGGCGLNGGRGAVGTTLAAGGGGGGGFALVGSRGTGSGPGDGGMDTGDDMISSYGKNFASGGGGGAVLLGSPGAAGGGGGGTVEVTAGGDVTVGVIDVTGGAGGTLGGVSDAGGGGGAGGAIVVRAGGTLVTDSLLANGGAGGNVSGAVGGAGSPGRIRWEALSGMPRNTSSPASVRGVSFAADTPFVATSSSPTLDFIGTAGHMFNVYSKDKDNHEMPSVMVSLTGSSMTSAAPPLSAGFNHVCITLGAHGVPEAERCVDIAYLP